jgi:hypothetical protein
MSHPPYHHALIARAMLAWEAARFDADEGRQKMA